MAKFIELKLEGGGNAAINIDRIDYVFESQGKAVIVQANEALRIDETYILVTSRMLGIIRS